MEEVKPYLDYMERELMFREAVIGFLVDEGKSEKKLEQDFCKACKVANKDTDCNTCPKSFELIEQDEGEKEI